MNFPPPDRSIQPPDPGSGVVVSASRIEANWQAITAELDAPRPSWIERFLRFCRVPAHTARVLVATPALRRAWFMAIALVVILGLIAANDETGRESVFTLLFLAPLAPVLGVALAYGPAADPSHEAQLAMPMSGLRVLLARAFVVLVVAGIVITTFALLNDQTRPYAAAWLLPALAVTSACLALMTYTSPRRAATIAAVGWIVLALVGRIGQDGLGAFAPAAQLVALAAAIGFLVIVYVRRETFDRLMVA